MCTFEEEEDACARWHHAPTDSIMCVCVRGPGKKIMTHTETSMMTFFYFFFKKYFVEDLARKKIMTHN